MYELFQVVVQDMSFIPHDDSLKTVNLVSFNIDELEFENEQDMQDFLNDDFSGCEDRLADDDGILYYDGTGKKYNGELDDDIYDYEKYEVSNDWANYDSFKTIEEANKHREELINDFKSNRKS